jgi:hypothetical protein
VILTTLYLVGAKTSIVGMPEKGVCSVLFLDAVLMVPSSAFVATAGGRHLLCNGFTLGETVRFGSLELITDHFDGLRLSPLGNGSGTAAMGPAYGGLSLPQ